MEEVMTKARGAGVYKYLLELKYCLPFEHKNLDADQKYVEKTYLYLA